MSEGSDRVLIEGIDRELERLSQELSGYEQLLERRRRLLAARSALSPRAGQAPGQKKRISQEEVAAYLAEHPDSWPTQIAADLDVPVTNISAHLWRGKHKRFVRSESGWRLREGSS